MSETLGETFYTVEDVAEKFQVNPATVRRWIDRGLVSPMRLGTNVRTHWRSGKPVDAAPYRFTEEDLRQLVESLRPAPKPDRRRRRRRAA